MDDIYLSRLDDSLPLAFRLIELKNVFPEALPSDRNSSNVIALRALKWISPDWSASFALR